MPGSLRCSSPCWSRSTNLSTAASSYTTATHNVRTAPLEPCTPKQCIRYYEYHFPYSVITLRIDVGLASQTMQNANEPSFKATMRGHRFIKVERNCYSTFRRCDSRRRRWRRRLIRFWESVHHATQVHVAGRNTRPRNAVIRILDTFYWFKGVAWVAPRAMLSTSADPQRGWRIRISVFSLQIRSKYGRIRRVHGSAIHNSVQNGSQRA